MKTLNPVVPAALGAACISSSAVLIQLSGAAAGTTAFFRCILALPGLGLLMHIEQRRLGRRTAKRRALATVAGAFLGTDLVFWAHSIHDVGAGVATVLGNLQVFFVTAIAWALLRERPHTRFLLALPVVLVGVLLVAGLLGTPRFGVHPLAGVVYGLITSIAYAIFLLVLRRATATQPHVAGPVTDATAGAVLSSLFLGLVMNEISFRPSWPALGWLVVLALSSQTLGWLLITSALPQLPAAFSSLLLLLQPAAALVLAAIVLSQRPTLAQVVGAVLVCGGVMFASRTAGQPGTVPEPAPG